MEKDCVCKVELRPGSPPEGGPGGWIAKLALADGSLDVACHGTDPEDALLLLTFREPWLSDEAVGLSRLCVAAHNIDTAVQLIFRPGPKHGYFGAGIYESDGMAWKRIRV